MRHALPALSVAAALGVIIGLVNNAVEMNGNVLLAVSGVAILIAGAVAERNAPSRRQ